MRRWLPFFFALLAASAFAYTPAPTAYLPRMELRPGPRALTATAGHGSGMFTTNASVTFTNNAVDQTTVSHFAEGQLSHRIWRNSAGETNRVQTFTWDARSRLIATTELDASNNGYNWSAVYDGLSRRLKTTTIIVTNGVALTNQPKVIASTFDPGVEFLELGVNVSGKARWKVYGPDLDGRYGGMNGTGGLDGVVDDVGVVFPLVSDARGNVLGMFDVIHGLMSWNTSRPTGYGAVPEHRPLSLSDSGDVGAAVGWRGRWPDRSGLIWLGARYYDPVAGRFISCDPYGHDADPSLYAFAGGDPINAFDPDGRLGKGAGGAGMDLLYGAAGLVNNTLGALGYAVASPFAPDWAYQNLGGYAEGFGNTVMGLGQTVYDVGAFASYALTSPFNNEFAYNNYGGSMERLGMAGTALSGGTENSGWYRAGYTAVGIGSLFIGGEFGQLGRIGRAGEITEMGVQAGMRERILANIAESQAARASSGVEGFIGREAAAQSGNPFAYYMQRANTLDVATAPNGAVFWSGLGNRTLAEQFALANGRTTLEMTPGGAWLDQQQLFNPALSPLTRDQARLVWSQASLRFSQGASGNAVGFVNGAGPQSLFNTVEHPSLINNHNVVNVITVGF